MSSTNQTTHGGRSLEEIEKELADLRADDRTLGLRDPNSYIASQRQWIQGRIRQLCSELEGAHMKSTDLVWEIWPLKEKSRHSVHLDTTRPGSRKGTIFLSIFNHEENEVVLTHLTPIEATEMAGKLIEWAVAVAKEKLKSRIDDS